MPKMWEKTSSREITIYDSNGRDITSLGQPLSLHKSEDYAEGEVSVEEQMKSKGQVGEFSSLEHLHNCIHLTNSLLKDESDKRYDIDETVIIRH